MRHTSTHPMRLLRPSKLAAIAVMFLAAPFCLAQSPAPTRPRITGISHVGYFVSDLPKTIAFWHDLLGFDESYDINKAGMSPANSPDAIIAFIKINDRQHIELFNQPPTAPPNHLSHISFSVDDIQQMRAYLISKGFAVKPVTGKTRAGDYSFHIVDPDGVQVEFVQTMPTGMEAQAAGKFQPAARISTHIYHLGFLVGNSQRSIDFYGNILGFKETWRGGSNPAELSWINMRVPDGTDYVEFMLYRKLPATFGGSNHIALEVPDLAGAVTALQARPAFKTYGKPLAMHTGVNGKRQANLFDPDGTRVELMEPVTADGKPVPSSAAPPPPPAHD
jgi:catechol 2,3-dioxygenase-like lactoylglutathione lyase family enzyme